MRQSVRLPEKITACLFDLDGVVTRTAELHAAAWKQTFDELLVLRASATGVAAYPGSARLIAAGLKAVLDEAVVTSSEDALAGVGAGREVGFGLVAGVDHAGQATALRAHSADLVGSDLAELTGAG